MKLGPTEPGASLGEVRQRLRRLGYLDHGVERFLLQDTLRSRPPLGTLLRLAARVGLLSGTLLAVGLALALAATNGSLAQAPTDAIILALHLGPPAILASGVTFLGLCGLLVALIQLAHVRRIQLWCLGVASAFGIAFVAFVARLLPVGGFHWETVLAAVLIAAAAFAVVRVVYTGLLGLASRLSAPPTQQSLLSRRGVVLAMVLGALALLVPAVVGVAHKSHPTPESLPRQPGDRVLVLGIDGVLGSEIDYLLAGGELPALHELAEAGRELAYPRGLEEPATFWTTLATGRLGEDHEVFAVDSFRPLGVRRPLARVGPTRVFWEAIEVPLGLAAYEPVLSSSRRTPAFWDLATRGGIPAIVVDWWSTFPARALTGLTVAHGAYDLLQSGGVGAVEPAEELDAVQDLARRVAAGESGESGESGEGEESEAAGSTDPGAVPSELPESPSPLSVAAREDLSGRLRGDLESRVSAPDRFYREAFRQALDRMPDVPLATLYLSAPDVATFDSPRPSLLVSDILRSELIELDRLIGDLAAGFDTVLVIVDPGRRNRGDSRDARDARDSGEARAEGRIWVRRREACDGSSVHGGGNSGGESTSATGLEQVEPAMVASMILRAAGLPQSEELPDPPPICSWPSPPARVPSYGQLETATDPAELGDEYLESLRSLGYL